MKKGCDPDARRARYGFNELARCLPTPRWKIFARQFNELLIYVLIGAALVTGWLGEWTDTGAIAGVVLLNGLMGYFQERKSGEAFRALELLAAPQATVLRDGIPQRIPARELLPDDEVALEEGDAVPADARLLRASHLQVQEAALTGESVPVDKEVGAPIYMGTTVVAGRARARVTAIGMRTELGRIAGMLQDPARSITPLQKRMHALGRTLLVICVALIGVTFALQIWRGGAWIEVFLLSVSLAVAAIPEGLPAFVTIALATGLRRMTARNALVRRLPSVETLGSVSVIATDKTGTLTRNEMAVHTLFAGGVARELSGPFTPGPALRELLAAGVICNHARLMPDGTRTGDPTDSALLVAARLAGLPYDRAHQAVVRDVPFDSRRKWMSVTVRGENRREVTYLKGALEAVLAECHVDEASAQAWRGPHDDFAARGLRVIALARDGAVLGLAAMMDPPRDGVREAIAECRAAGIKPVMITGDHPATALAIARTLGIAGPEDRVVTGDRLDTWPVAETARTAVYARVLPEQKLEIIRRWKSLGAVVAMTGDGVNDAPAVRDADIGIAMGTTGTDVTKQASDLVLLDDNFATIVAAVEEGRTILANIRKVLFYLLAGNAGELLVMFMASLLGLPYPLLATQILWVNLITDGLPALALCREPPEPDLMQHPPLPLAQPLLTRQQYVQVALRGGLVALVTLTAFGAVAHGDAARIVEARAVAFATLSFAHVMMVLAFRSDRVPIWRALRGGNGALIVAVIVSLVAQVLVMTLPGVREWFDVTTPLSAADWRVVLCASAGPLVVIEAGKLFRARVALKRARSAREKIPSPERSPR